MFKRPVSAPRLAPRLLAPLLLALAACSGSSTEPDSQPATAARETPPLSGMTSQSSDGEEAEATAPHSDLATFVDPDTGLSTRDVRDADREIVHFDVQTQSMIWAASGDPVGGWVTQGNELRWQRTGGAFRVRFGSEGGEPRAYFTEPGPGTICNLSITAPEQLSISPTSETPPRS